MGDNMKKDWYKRLPAGEYTLRQVVEFAGLKSLESARAVLLNHGATVKLTPVEGKHFSKCIMIWPGFKKEKAKHNK